MSKLPARPPVVTDSSAVFDARRKADLGRPFPLAYGNLPSALLDLPDFPRAASALRRWQGGHVVVQDDVNALAVGAIGGAGALEPWLLPRGAERRRRFDATLGNKRDKLDLEAALVLPDGRLLVLGSGSLPARERIVVVDRDGATRVLEAGPLYAALRRQVAFAGSELNIEGALVFEKWLVLLQRGNGAPSGDVAVVNALGLLPLADFTRWLDHGNTPPALERVVRVDLGAPHGVRIGFTDAALQTDGTIAFLACAEDTPNAIDDGAVVGSYFGRLDLATEHALLVQITESDGDPCRLKLEGIETRPDDPERFDVVADTDDPDAPALAAVLHVGVVE